MFKRYLKYNILVDKHKNDGCVTDCFAISFSFKRDHIELTDFNNG